MASRALLAALVVIAGVLAALVVAGRAPPAPQRTDRRIAPECSAGALRRIRITDRHRSVIELGRAGDDFVTVQPAGVPLDRERAEELWSTVELLSYRRALARDQAPGSGLDRPLATIELSCAGSRILLALGASLRAGGLHWLGRGDRAYLVERYRGEILARGLDELRSRDPLPAGAETVELARAGRALSIAGAPAVVRHRPGGAVVRVSAAAARELSTTLAALRLQRFLRPAARPQQPCAGCLAVRATAAGRVHELRELGPCPGAPSLRAVASPLGPGCVEAGPLARLAGLVRAPRPLYDRRLLAGGAAALRELALARAGQQISLRRERGRLVVLWAGAASATEPSLADEFLAQIDELPERWLPDAPGGAQVATLTLAHGERSGAQRDRLRVLQPQVGGPLCAVRSGETGCWRLGAAADALLRVSAVLALEERTRWIHEPTGLSAVAVEQGGAVREQLVRGELVGDWLVRSPAGRRPRSELLESLRQPLAQLRAQRLAGGPECAQYRLATPRRSLVATFDDRGAEIEHRIELGATAPDGGCYARLDRAAAVHLLDAGLCRLLSTSLVRP